jgi:RNA polymerase sigma-70 factor (ECF subfamily)
MVRTYRVRARASCEIHRAGDAEVETTVRRKEARSATATRAGAIDAHFVERLYGRYRPSVLRRAASMLSDREAARDVTQEVFMRALCASAEFLAARSPLSWLYRITTNLCLNRLRDTRRRKDILAQVTSFEEASTGPAGEGALTLETLMVEVPRALREIAVYYYVDQMSQDEIATMLSVPRRTVGYRLEQFLDIARAANDRRPHRA